MPTVVLIGTLDTKGREYRYLKQCLQIAGLDVLLVDVGVVGEPTVVADISARDVAAAAGTTIEQLRFSREGSDTRAVALAAMQRGAIAVAKRLHGQGRCDALLGAAGSGGTTIISGVMQAMPLGLPKLLVSTMAAMSLSAFAGTRDITVMHAVTDIAGLNRFSRRILRNAAFAAAGMAKGAASSGAEPVINPLVAITMFGVTTPGVLRVQDRLHAAGFETIVFHAVGSGGRAMEDMIAEGLVDGVVDYTVSELTDELLGGVFTAGANRLEAAGKMGIPQVIVPGAIEVLNFGPRATVPPRFDTPARRLIVHNPHVCAVRTTKEEAVQLARVMAEKLNKAIGSTAVMVPLLGFDKYQQRPDGPYIDPEADDAFLVTLRNALRSDIRYREEQLNINDPEFADATVETFVELWQRHRTPTPSAA
jgi:uncharacterized protein (UPF0261 family)